MSVATVAATTWQDDIGRVVRLDEGADGFHRSWIMLFPVGAFTHPEYGKLDFSRARLARMKQHFDERVRKIDIALDADHRASAGDSRATGWIEQMELREAQPDGTPAGLWARVRWTPYGLQLLKDQEYRYFSPDFGDFTDPVTGTVTPDVINGGGLTNRPFLKMMREVTLAEGVSTRPWSSVDKSKLPNSAFLDPARRRLPVYEGTGPIGKDGRYTKRGKLNIHGLSAAKAAVHGAHTGKPMSGLPAGVADRIERLLAQHGGRSSGGGGGSAGGSGSGSGSGAQKMSSVKTDTKSQQGLENGADEGALLFMGGSSTSGSLGKAPLGAHEADDDMETESLDDMGTDDGMQYDDGDGDGDGGGEPEFDAESNTHGQMTTDGHAHGKFGKHSHDGDASHADAPIKRGKQMREPLSPKEQRLAEMVESQQQQLRELQYKLYEQEVTASVARLSESLSAQGAGVSKVFRDAFQSLMLSEGFAMSEATRNKVVRVIDLALRRGMVDLSRRAQALSEMDAKATGPSAEMALPKDAPEGDRQLMEEAHRMALSEKLIQPGQNILAIDQAKRADLLLRAGRQIGSK